MLKKILFIIISVFILQSYAQEENTVNISQYDISILTIGPGNSLSDAFGHSGVRVIDRKNNFD